MNGSSQAAVFIALLMTETNSFAPIPTGLASFEEAGMTRRDGSLDQGETGGGFMSIFRTLAEGDGHAVIESLSALAQPSGPTVQPVYERLRDMILDDLRAAGPVGQVMLGLHGAMMASGCDDCEGDILARVREIVGPDVPVGALLDPHCHLTEKMVANADAIVIMKEYPHTDWDERAAELYAILIGKAEGKVSPASSVFDCRMVGFYPTTVEPMQSFVRQMKDAEQEPDILSVSLAHGFPWGDQAEAGTRMLVIANGDGEIARTTAERLGRQLYRLRDDLLPNMPDIAQAIDRARALDGLVVMADTADNAGGGAPGDTTHLLRALVESGLGPCAFGAVFDPGAVRICEEAGVGATVMLRIGGKLGASSGEPYGVEVEVVALRPDHGQSFLGSHSPLGPSAWVRIGDVDVVITSIRSQIFARDGFTGLGISLDDKKVVAVKSSEHFRADFGPITKHVISVATPGAIQMNFTTMPYRHKRDMHFHPRVPDPLAIGN
ncbi:M81 family metallopeptidase [Sphingosinicella rhizophila]|uniref:Microcystinase C n=1 Tax=Sphingosinicella rhizophila TaxID=3050082 RepID=A0ABU3Q6P2_9SPHN|nr:M81 family metallopeptidase [Sphingosinicella sp. GR2756]MDT9598759.1 M81 family metallopeptidase [Sphingosinicella sp. GR2756]